MGAQRPIQPDLGCLHQLSAQPVQVLTKLTDPYLCVQNLEKAIFDLALFYLFTFFFCS